VERSEAGAEHVERKRVAPYLPEVGAVTVFSAVWCGHCSRLKAALSRTGVPFREVLIEEDPEAERIAIEANGGDWLIPTLLFSDGSALVNPAPAEVVAHLALLEDGV
jgi:mycoredoxin